MDEIKRSDLSTMERRVLKAFHTEQKRKQLKMKANIMHAKGYPAYKIADILGVSEGTVRFLISVNGGY